MSVFLFCCWGEWRLSLTGFCFGFYFLHLCNIYFHYEKVSLICNQCYLLGWLLLVQPECRDRNRTLCQNKITAWKIWGWHFVLHLHYYPVILLYCVWFSASFLIEQLKMIVVCVKGQIVYEDYMTNEAAHCVSLVSESYPQQLGPVQDVSVTEWPMNS